MWSRGQGQILEVGLNLLMGLQTRQAGQTTKTTPSGRMEAGVESQDNTPPHKHTHTRTC